MYRDACALLDEARVKRQNRSINIPNRIQQALNATRTSELELKHAIMDKIRELLKKFDTSEEKYRSNTQVKIQNKMLGTTCMLVYGEKLYRKFLPEIKRYNKLLSVKQQMFYSAPRRGGKTEAMAQWAAAVMLVCPSARKLAIFSMSSRTSGKSGLLGNIADKMRELGLQKENTGANNKEIFELYTDGLKKTIAGYPGAVHRYRYVYSPSIGFQY